MVIKSIELHGFCDTSECAYVAVVYLRIAGEDGNVVTLVISKTNYKHTSFGPLWNLYLGSSLAPYQGSLEPLTEIQITPFCSVG